MISEAVSDPTEAKLTITLSAGGTGRVVVTGPKHAPQRDSVDDKLAWSAGKKPTTRILDAGG